jgi:threonylcarbamoyladenosine tRNA methylthiotransferase MtaB
MNKRVAFQTLGCRLNQYETDSIATDFRRAGYTIVPYDDEADCYVVNTCTVTDKSDRKSRNLINRALRRDKNPVVVATGCFVDAKSGYFDEHPDITYAVGNDEKYRIFDLVDAHFRNELGGTVDEANRGAGVDRTIATDRPDRFAFGDALEGFHTRANIKIQDGCDNFCTFCIIPFVRGDAISRPAADVIEHARRVIGEGAKEIVLTGVNMGRYERDGIAFVKLVEELLELPGDFRLRLSSLEPDIRGEGFSTIISHEKFCPHLHLCLQSGSDRILLAMRRQYDVSGYLDFVESIRRNNTDFNFTTDVLVGFPGETDADFSETLGVIREVGFSHIHTFPYSLRTGTRAERLPGHIDDKTKTHRATRVRDIATIMKRAYRSRFVGRIERLLVERTNADGRLTGYGAHYLPIVASVVADAAEHSHGDQRTEHNRFFDVEIAAIADGDDPALLGDVR